MTELDWKIAKAMRRMQRRREKCIAIRLASKIMVVTLLMGAVVTFSGAVWTPTETVHDVYIVREGDAFWTLTEKYRGKDVRDPYILEYMDEIKKLNPEIEANHGRIHPGQEIRFEYEVR